MILPHIAELGAFLARMRGTSRVKAGATAGYPTYLPQVQLLRHS